MTEHPSEKALEEAIDLVMGEWFNTRSEIEARKDAPQRVARALDARDKKIAAMSMGGLAGHLARRLTLWFNGLPRDGKLPDHDQILGVVQLARDIQRDPKAAMEALVR